MATIQLNGNSEEVAEATTVSGLLDSRGVNPNRVVVELNRRILAREEYTTTSITAGDILEVVTFVGGG
jgi:thiamine biosynthesis protein ThiS